ncbi:MAG: hypothetical protein VYA68_00490 [Pseudomonadota bacterium]|nr:hypothetical protein [Pseudomonadota bacterium]
MKNRVERSVGGQTVGGDAAGLRVKRGGEVVASLDRPPASSKITVKVSRIHPRATAGATPPAVRRPPAKIARSPTAASQIRHFATFTAATKSGSLKSRGKSPPARARRYPYKLVWARWLAWLLIKMAKSKGRQIGNSLPENNNKVRWNLPERLLKNTNTKVFI